MSISALLRDEAEEADEEEGDDAEEEGGRARKRQVERTGKKEGESEGHGEMPALAGWSRQSKRRQSHRSMSWRTWRLEHLVSVFCLDLQPGENLRPRTSSRGASERPRSARARTGRRGWAGGTGPRRPSTCARAPWRAPRRRPSPPPRRTRGATPWRRGAWRPSSRRSAACKGGR